MQKFFLTISLNHNFEQEIHKESCLYKPELSETIYLGSFKNQRLTLEESKKFGKKTNGCFWCCKEIHSNENLKIIF